MPSSSCQIAVIVIMCVFVGFLGGAYVISGEKILSLYSYCGVQLRFINLKTFS